MKRMVTTVGAAVVLSAAGGGIALAATGNSDPAPEQQQEAAYTAAHSGEAAVSRDEAVATATQAHPGTVSDVHLENEGDGLRWEVKPDDGKAVHEVQIDAQTGKIVSDHLDD